MKNIEMLKYSLKHASPDAVREVIRKLDVIWNECYDESEQLEKLDVVVDLEPEQRKRAAELESILSIICSITNLCYDVLPEQECDEHA